jgi:CubicO group peptidase (beta-lactamase class C family)
MKKTLFLFILSVIANCSYAQDFIKDSLDIYIERGMKRWQVPGLAIAIIKDGKIVVAKGYGVKELGKPDKIDANTLFMIGSNSKAFTATSLSILESENKLSLDDKVTKWLPYFKMYDTLAEKDARIRDMLCHRSGLQTFQGDFTYWESNLTRKQVIERFGKNIPKYPFRTKYGYCNAGFVTAGEVIPMASGIQWESFVRERIFKAVGMNSTIALTSEMPFASNRASPHSIYEKSLINIPYCNIDNLAAAGSISSSANDMVKWLQMQLDTGKVAGQQIIPKEAIIRTWEPQINTTLSKSRRFTSQFYNYCLGWFVRDYNGKRVYDHSGGVNGFVSNSTFIPELNAGFVILTNTDSNDLYASLRMQLTEHLVNLPNQNIDDIFWKNHQIGQKEEDKILQEELSKITEKTKPNLPLIDYAGKYTHHVYGDIEVKIIDKMLVLDSPIHGKLSAKIQSQGGNSFWCTFVNKSLGSSSVLFFVKENKIETMTIKVADFIEYDPYVFKKLN